MSAGCSQVRARAYATAGQDQVCRRSLLGKLADQLEANAPAVSAYLSAARPEPDDWQPASGPSAIASSIQFGHYVVARPSKKQSRPARHKLL